MLLGGRVRFTREEQRKPLYKLNRRRRQWRSWFPLISVAVVAAIAGVVALVAPETVGVVTRDLTASVLTGTGAPGTPGSGPIVGRASVIDGDTLEINGTRIRLHGIDAPESRQSCIVAGKKSLCGRRATYALAQKIGNQIVTCEPKDIDRYNRVVAVCRAEGEDLNAWMVAHGWAVAYRRYSTDYVGHEKTASGSKLGIWRGEFMAPSEWRRANRRGATTARNTRTSQTAARRPTKTAGCIIKGNISRGGERIFHLPSGKYYGRTRINGAKGERWFCSKSEARRAGWRQSRR